MKKKLAQITSCLLCLAMLVSMAGPAVAVTAGDFYEEIVLDPDLEITDDPLNIAAPDTGDGDPSAMDSLPVSGPAAEPLEADGEYEIYPTPHSVTYGAASSTITLPSSLPVVYGGGIDQATKNRAKVAFDQVGVTLNETASASGMALRVSIKADGDGVTSTTSNLFSKDGAYKLTIDSNGVTIVGVNTDAAFYGLTSMKHILYQVAKQSAGNKTVRTLVMEDYADVAFRGFIEGYYGNPWSVEDRAELMRFGGEMKMNIYFYAPKDDPKHNAKWRELYTTEELNTLIKPLADAGNESKCYYGFALHAFMNSPFNMNNYDADLATLKAKYEQAMTVGVRQIALLGDDANLPLNSSDGANNGYIRILNDLTDWLKSDEMQRKYPGLQTSIPFCPGPNTRYAHSTGNDALLKSLAPVGVKSGKLTGNVPIIMTGGAVWGHVSNTFASSFTNNVGVGPFYWVNWPCTDNSKSSLVFGGHDITLEQGVTPGSVKGIMLNPMQQSEPSKWGIFQNADYAWNLWQSDDRATQAGYDGFKYVDHMGADETPASTALRELAKHMIRMNGNGNTNYNESIELSSKLTQFKTKLENSTLTTADIDDMRGEFATLYNAAVTFRDGDTTGRNTRILGKRNDDGSYPLAQEQMAPWLDAWVDLAGGAVDLLDALKASLNNSDGSQNGEIVSNYVTGQSKVSAARNHGFTYMDHTEYATVGGQHVTPFVTPLLKHVAQLAQNIIDPSGGADSREKLTGTVITNKTAYGGYPISNLIDGSDDTFFWANSASAVNDYIGLDLGSVKSVGRIRFVIGGNKSSDRWTSYKLQYSTDNSTWTDFKTYSGSGAQSVEDEDVGYISARYIRVVNLTAADAWAQFSEFTVWAGPESGTYGLIAYQSKTVKKIASPVAVLQDDLASLSSSSVQLRPGEFIGIQLPRVRDVVELTADYSAPSAPGLVLKAGISELMLSEIDDPSGFSGPTRYIRLENTGTQAISFVLNELSARSDEITGIVFDSSDMARRDGQDARTNNVTGNWFDGNVATSAKYCDQQIVGKYVCYDLGQTRSIRDIKVYITDSQTDYIRNGKIQVSMDKENWVDVVNIAATSSGADVSAREAGWKNSSTYPNYVYQDGQPAGGSVDARYLRVVFTKENFTAKWLVINEIVINDGEYAPSSNDPTFVADPVEVSAQFIPSNLLDGDLTTGFRPNMTDRTSGSLLYRLSDETSIEQVNIIQSTSPVSDATVSIRTDDGWQTLNATLDTGFNQVAIPEDVVNVHEIKLEWGNVTPTFYEIITVPRIAVAGEGQQVASSPEDIPINSYGGTDRSILFDDNWRFYFGDNSGASATVFDDTSWRLIDLPHDYSIEQDYTSAGEAESGYLLGGVGWYRKGFTLDPSWENKVISINFGGVYMDTEIWLNGTKLGENHYGYNPFSFVLPSNLLTFSGENVIAIRVNNPVPSSRWYSGSGIYRSVHLTVTNPIHVAQYGTYVNPVNSSGTSWTVNVKTDVQNDTAAASTVAVKQEIFKLDSSYQPTGSAVATVTQNSLSLSSNATSSANQTLTVSNPDLWNSWDVGTPNLYVLKTTISQGSTVLDTYETEFGFRTFNFDVDTGFSLNGRNVKLKGVCQHHDQGGLGAEAWYRALERQVDILMGMGVNGIRVTHNPAADELIEICNRKGVLIIDELFDGWALAKNGNTGDFSRWFNRTITADNKIVGASAGMKWQQFVTERVVNRDKNAPCVIMYSIGNEVQEGSGTDGNYATYANEIIGWIQAIDRTRPVTRGDNTRTSSQTGEQGLINKAIHDAGGVVGFNYHTVAVIDAGHANGWRMLGSEAASHINSRGIYNIKATSTLNSKKRMTSYDKGHVGWGYTVAEGWWRTIPYDYNAGEFVWTGFDYMGEPTPNNGTGSGWANGSDSPKNSFFGVIDTNGIPKDGYYLYRSMWNESDTTLHVLPTWDRDDLIVSSDGKVEVVVYSNAPVVKVFLNGVEQGSATATTHTTGAGHKYRTFDSGTGCFSRGSNSTSLYATFNVPYATGTLEVKAYQANGTTEITDTVGRDIVKTTTGADSLRLTADRATIKNDDRDLSYVTIDVVDAKGEIINGAEPNITVSVSGPGKLMALDNGVQPDHTSFLVNHRTAGAGRLVAIIQSTDTEGAITVTATTDDGQTGSTTINATGAETSSTGDVPVSYTMSKTIFVQCNTRPKLPETVEVNLGNGTSVTKAVTWNSYNEGLLSTVGSEFSITGTIADYNLTASIGIVVLDDVAALLNYSAAVHVGQTPTLPATRPAVMANGTVLTAQFPVTWDAINSADYQQEGTVTVNGSATVFGAEYAVTATIRVTNGTVSVGGNVIDAVSAHPNGFSIDGIDNAANRAILNSLRDGNTANAAWTGHGTLHFAYDTQQNFYRIRLTYTHSAPSDVTLTLERGAVSIQPTISGNTATYELGAINASEFVDLGFPSQVSLSEVEFIVGTPIFTVNSTATLNDIKLNGESATPAQLAAKLVKTSASTAAIVPVTNSNVAVTILPENSSSQVIIVTESEDHGTREVYTVQFDAPEEVTDPADDSRDYPYTKTTAYAPSQHGADIGDTEGPASFAVDGNESSFYHSRWSATDNDTGTAGNSQGQGDLASYADQRYIQLELQEATALVALRYLPRSGNSLNGTITQYRVDVSTDGSSYTPIGTGNWAQNHDWKLATFDRTVTAKYVRLYGVTTYADSGNNRFLSAGEIRVVRASEDKPDLSAATIVIDPSEFRWTGAGIRPGSGNEGATVTVTLNGVELQRPRDYVLSYDNNVDPGTAYLYIRAASGSNYKGSNSATFQIIKDDAKIISFQPFTVSVQPGIAPVLPTTVVGTTNKGGTMEVSVTWDSVPADWYNFPQEKTRTLQGTIRDTGLLQDPTLRPEVTLQFAYSQSADSVSLRTMVGVMPTLPTTATIHFDNGESGVRAVTKWYLASHGDTPEAAAAAPAVTVADFASAGIIQLRGVITGIDRVRAIANVRVVDTEGMVPSDENLALNTSSSANIFPFALAYESAGNNNPYQAIKGQTTGSTAQTDRWSDWERNTYHTADETWMGVAFETSTQNVVRAESTVLTLVPHLVNKVKVMFVDENGSTNSAVTFPQDYQIQYYTGPVEDLTFNTNITSTGDSSADNGGNSRVRYWTGSPLLDSGNWANVELVGSKPAVPSQNGRMLELNFIPVNTAIIRVQCTSKTSKWTGIQALEVYGLVPEAKDDFTVTSVTLGGQEKITEFDENKVLEVTLGLNEAIPELAVAVNLDDNASVSITQATRVPGVGEPGAAWAQAVITSEDGSKTETYTVKFDREGAPASFSVDLNGVSEASRDKITVTPTGGAPGTEITITPARGYQFTVLRAQVTTGELAGQNRDIRDGKFILPAGNVSITAEVTPIPYKMTYLLNGGTVERFNPNSYNVNTTTFTLYNPTKPGYIFVGWVGAGLTSPTLSVTIPKGSIGDRTYTAVWKADGSIGGGGGNNGGGGGGGSAAVDPTPVGDVTVTTVDRNTGAVTVTTTTMDGLVSAVTTTVDGKQTAVIQVPENSATDVTAIMPALDAAKGPVVTIQNNTTRPVTVTVPFIGGETVVAVRQNSDGSETIIPMSVVDADGLRLKSKPGDQIIRLEDNKKSFADVSADHWAARAVDFVSSRELFNGMGSTDTFAPAAPMNRAMMTTVLWRLAEKPSTVVTDLFDDVLAGSYYEEAVAWGVANGVVKGTDIGFEPDTPVTRETLAVLLYRAAGSPVVVDELPRRFTDGEQVADWALEAMIWCVQNDIIKGRDAQTLAPKDVANRAEVATMLQRFVNQQV